MEPRGRSAVLQIKRTLLSPPLLPPFGTRSTSLADRFEKDKGFARLDEQKRFSRSFPSVPLSLSLCRPIVSSARRRFTRRRARFLAAIPRSKAVFEDENASLSLATFLYRENRKRFACSSTTSPAKLCVEGRSREDSRNADSRRCHDPVVPGYKRSLETWTEWPDSLPSVSSTTVL